MNTLNVLRATWLWLDFHLSFLQRSDSAATTANTKSVCTSGYWMGPIYQQVPLIHVSAYTCVAFYCGCLFQGLVLPFFFFRRTIIALSPMLHIKAFFFISPNISSFFFSFLEFHHSEKKMVVLLFFSFFFFN